MKISLNTIRGLNQRYQSAGDPAPNGADDLVEKIGAQLGAVEEIIDIGKKYDGVLVVKIVECKDHENSDHLHVCKIDDGGKAEGAERDENGHVQVVCGAPNVREGLTVAWLPPGSTVPESFDDAEPFVLSVRSLRGVDSNGMLASQRELALGESHDGILELPDTIQPGTAFADAFNLRDDKIIDMENKMFTHRPDCFGWIGVARELEGIQRRAYKSPAWYQLAPEFPGVETDELKLEVRNEVPNLVPRFMAAVMSNVKVGPSPLVIQIELAKHGVRPINNIVDYTNFFMLETGQPLHAYDYDKVKAQDAGADHATLVVRHPHTDEKITLLNGKEIEPRAEAIMIASCDKLLGVGGVMGGGDTEVDAGTTNIILECATFDMYSIRRTAMAHGLFTDAVTRNNKGQSPLQNAAVLAKIVDEVRRFAAGKVASAVVDINHVSDEARAHGSLHPAVTITSEFINARLGLKLAAADIATLLTNVEFRVDVDGENLTITAPFWRTDIELREDIVEEVGRLYGFDHLPLKLPKRDITPTQKDPMFELKKQVRETLSRAGANELLTYNFVHGNLMEKVGQKTEQAFQLSNALSPELQYLRMSLTPSLLEKVHGNVKAGYDQFALFEMNKSHNLLHTDDENGLPMEFSNLALVVTKSDKILAKGEGAAFYDARKYLDMLAQSLGIELDYVPLTEDMDFPVTQPFDLSRSAIVTRRGNHEAVFGIAGEFRASVCKALKLPRHTAGFEIGMDGLLRTMQSSGGYVQLSRFPKTEQDMCLKVDANCSYATLHDFVEKALAEVQPENTVSAITPVDIYQRQDDPVHKQITFHLTITNYEKTMRDEEVTKLLDHVASKATTELGAERI